MGVLTLILTGACGPSIDTLPTDRLFTVVPAEISGVHFSNQIIESEDFHYYKYVYSYNGAGVASADFNNDGLVDLFFTSNLKQSRLYINEGDFKFSDVTRESGIEKSNGFNTGVSVVDINSDGYLDIYLCSAGWLEEEGYYSNKLYVNNGDLTFTEKAADYGLSGDSRSMAAVFFDYDRDGDLDVYISNSPNDQTLAFDLSPLREIESDTLYHAFKGSDKLYNNDGTGHFTDVSMLAGITPDIAYGLSVQVCDLNGDDWPDILVANDFKMPDFALVNNRDGTFSEQRDRLFKHLSYYSMGSDHADINNDGLGDIVVLDMSPEDYTRKVTTMSMTPPERFAEMVDMGYHHQYMQNVLQLNNGNGTFSEIANMAGVANTDWSWAALLADFDLDGYNDLYVTNGIYRDVTHRDKVGDIHGLIRQRARRPTDKDFLEYTRLFPQEKITNYLYQNQGDLTFEDKSNIWVDAKPTFSNGAVYADFDNDGDLDIAISNLNEKATILKNNATEQNRGNHIQFNFEGPQHNQFGIGVRINIFSSNQIQTRELLTSRGYLSALSNILHFGLGSTSKIAKIEINWTDGKQQVLRDVSVNQLITIKYSDAKLPATDQADGSEETETMFIESKFDYGHSDPAFDDFQRQLLLPHKLSQTGPAIAKSDVNGDGFEDLYLGGGHKQPGQLLFGSPDDGFKEKLNKDFYSDRFFEDVGACFFDVDNDGDSDLYVVSGSYEFENHSKLLQDRLYINHGKGQFRKADNVLPEMLSAGSVVKPCDYDQDGDVDLFVGGRVVPGRYPYAPTSYLLINHKGRLKVSTPELAPALENVGMVTDAQWVDVNNDGHTDLMVTGEWMGIEIFINQHNRLLRSDLYPTLSSSIGWWNKLLVVDVDDDNDLDIVAGNQGGNYKIQPSKELPFHVYTYDFDKNGIEDVVLAKQYDNHLLPMRGKVCMTQQIPPLAHKVSTFIDFASSDLVGILGNDLNAALHYQATELRSGIFIKTDKGAYSFLPFANVVQRSPINSMVYEDVDGDGTKDLLLAGNNYHTEIETTRSDAGIGSLLTGNGNGTFSYISNLESGFYADQDVRNITPIETANGRAFLVANNNSNHDLFRFNIQERQ